MREHLDQRVLTIGEVATEIGVSQQTLRVWEAKKLLNPLRSAGGQRLYSDEAVERARKIAQLRRDNGWNPAAIATVLSARPDGSSAIGVPRNHLNLRKARLDRGLTLKDLASRVDVASGTLSAIERGESSISSALIARLADALLVPMSLLASSAARQESVIRKDSRPTTVNKGGVTWEELGAPGHDMEPALLVVPFGEDSGGEYSRPGETFSFIMKGSIEFAVSKVRIELHKLNVGDAITIPGRTIFSWRNSSRSEAIAIWVESLNVGHATT